MKLSLALISLLFSMTAMAAISRGQLATVEGVVKFESKATVTCLAIGCPPSVQYYTFGLVNANVVGGLKLQNVVFGDVKERFNTKIKPSYFVYGNARLKEGMYVQMTGTVEVLSYSTRAFALFTNPVEVKVLNGTPRR